MRRNKANVGEKALRPPREKYPFNGITQTRLPRCDRGKLPCVSLEKK
jgi:hypothetical protein